MQVFPKALKELDNWWGSRSWVVCEPSAKLLNAILRMFMYANEVQVNYTLYIHIYIYTYTHDCLWGEMGKGGSDIMQQSVSKINKKVKSMKWPQPRRDPRCQQFLPQLPQRHTWELPLFHMCQGISTHMPSKCSWANDDAWWGDVPICTLWESALQCRREPRERLQDVLRLHVGTLLLAWASEEGVESA